MARARAQKDILSRLADAGEEAIQKLSDAPGADRFMNAASTMRDRLDEMQKRLRGLEQLEQRLAALERKVDRLSKSGSAAPATRKTAATTRKTTTTKSSGASRARKT
jgi:TolA-binding protein